MNKQIIHQWKRVYARTLEAAFILSLLVIMTVFFSFQKYEGGYELPIPPDMGPTIVIDIPPTEQLKKAPPPARPSIPVEADEEEIAEAVTIDYTKLAMNTMQIEPPPVDDTDDPPYQFFQVSEKPVITNKVKPLYPEMAKRVGIEGTVVITVLIGKTGKVEEVKVFKDIAMLTESAERAAWKCEFKPAKQRDKYVKVWMNVPFKFYLR